MTDIKKEKWVFIINPISGNGSSKIILPKLEEMIKKHDIDAELVFTERRGHATEISEKYSNAGFTYIIGVGGDGTINEIARPLINRKDITIGLIPAGTGNDFIQIPGFPNRFEEADWETFFKIQTIRMDVGSVNWKIFLNGMGLGFDAEVAAQNYTKSGEVKEGGFKYRYVWHIVKTLLFFKEKRMIAKSSTGKTETDCFINTIAIGRRFAGGFLLTPGALANDGLLDVCMIKRLTLPQRFGILLKVPKGEHVTDKKVNYYKTPGTSLEFTEKVPFHVDGELFFSKEFDVKILPEALNIIYNPDGNHFFKK
jgi:diacylglycerol kinase (ATP)